jgi:peptide/nickel transport system permease protein
LSAADVTGSAARHWPNRWRSRFSVTWTKSLIVGTVILTVFVFVALLAPWLEPYGVHEKVGEVFASPSLGHPLGLDGGGYDVVSRLMEGARVSLLISAAASAVAMLIGGGIGIAAGYVGGRTDGVLMRITDYFIVVPALPLMIVVSAVWGPSLSHVILIVGLLLWAPTARVIRAHVLSLRERAFIRRSQAMGASDWRIVTRHVLPHTRALLVANTVLTVAVAVFFESALAFLGLESADTISWGTIIADGFQRAAISNGAWWAILPAGVCIALVVVGCNLVGTAIEDSANPRVLVPYISRRRFSVERRRHEAEDV